MRAASIRAKAKAASIRAKAKKDRETTPEDRLQKIITILAALPPLPDRADSVQACAERLLINAAMTLVNDTPRANAGTIKQAIAELDEFGELSARLIELVYGMHRISLDTLKTPKRRVILPSSAVCNPVMSEIGRHPFVVASDLRVLALAAAVKIKELKSALKSAPPEKPPGPPEKRHAANVTKAAAAIFEQLTGRPAKPHTLPDGKAGGPLVKFLAAVFAALEIDAKAGSQARSFRELSRKKESLSSI